MIYTSAIYANPDHTMVTGTDANGATETVPVDHTVFRCPDHGPVGFVNNGGSIADYETPAEPSSYRLYKSTFIQRMTDQEAATMETVLSGAAAKLRMLFQSVEWFQSDDPLFLDLHVAVSGALGSARADVLLAAE